MTATRLPDDFTDLEPWVAEWALASEPARNKKRIASSIETLRGFYDALLPRMDTIIGYLKTIGFDDLSAADTRLLHLALMFMEVAGAIEVFFAPDVPNSFEPERFHILAPFAQTAVAPRGTLPPNLTEVMS